jgi:hypothetical protein
MNRGETCYTSEANRSTAMLTSTSEQMFSKADGRIPLFKASGCRLRRSSSSSRSLGFQIAERLHLEEMHSAKILLRASVTLMALDLN